MPDNVGSDFVVVAHPAGKTPQIEIMEAETFATMQAEGSFPESVAESITVSPELTKVINREFELLGDEHYTFLLRIVLSVISAADKASRTVALKEGIRQGGDMFRPTEYIPDGGE